MLLIIVLLIIVRAVFRISKLIYSSLPSGTLIAPVPTDCQPGVLPSIPHHFLLIKRKAGICSIYGFYTWVYVWESCLHAQWGRWEGALSPPVHLAQEQLPSCTLCWVRAELWKPQPGPSWTQPVASRQLMSLWEGSWKSGLISHIHPISDEECAFLSSLGAIKAFFITIFGFPLQHCVPSHYFPLLSRKFVFQMLLFHNACSISTPNNNFY